MTRRTPVGHARGTATMLVVGAIGLISVASFSGGCESTPGGGASTPAPGVRDQPNPNEAAEASIYDPSLPPDNDR